MCRIAAKQIEERCCDFNALRVQCPNSVPNRDGNSHSTGMMLYIEWCSCVHRCRCRLAISPPSSSAPTSRQRSAIDCTMTARLRASRQQQARPRGTARAAEYPYRHWDSPMANEEHVAILKKGVDAWNAWRDKNPDIRPDLSEANLSDAELAEADLSRADLSDAHLSEAI